MKRTLLIAICSFAAGALVTGIAAYRYHIWHMIYVLNPPSQYSYKTMIIACPPSGKLKEEDMWVSALEDAQWDAEKTLNQKKEGTRGELSLRIVPRRSGYEVMAFSAASLEGRRDEIRSTISACITKAQREQAKLMLDVTEKVLKEFSKMQTNQALAPTATSVTPAADAPVAPAAAAAHL